MNETLERLKAEEAELEARFNNPSETIEEPVVVEEAVTVEQTEDELDAAEYIEDVITGDGEGTTGSPEPEQEPAPTRKERTNWKKRFTNFKASADATIYGLRSEVADLKGQMAVLYEEIRKAGTATTAAPKDPFAGVFSAEDEATFGADGLDVVKRGTQAAIDNATKPLKDQLDKAEKERIDSLKAQAKRATEEQYASFIGRLGDLVPEYKKVNFDPKFLEWMKQPDTYSGITRATLFSQAEKARDVARVAEFFVEYQRISAPPPREDMSRHITPIGGGGAPSPSVAPKAKETGELIYTSEIDKFYDDVIKGYYHGKHDQVLAIEAKIDLAQMQGRIRKG